ncbi:MAG TPA: fused MFS/spermidine synthase, partial [Methylomirabilota bacterium]|nr:fused MFS/spermidine synthase [Methylomirabilota bacterium]
ASAHRELLSDGVELLPEVIEVMPLFAPANADPARNPRLRVMVADARRFVRTSGGGYDVIVADLFHPSRDGAGALYTREHFIAVRDRLAPGGVFCQWLPLYQLDDRTLRVIVRTFLDVFPTAEAWLLRLNIETPVIGLVGYRDAPAKVVEPRVRFGRDSELAAQLKQLVLTDEVQLFGCLAAEATSLAAFAADARVNTDDHPHVMFDAPRAALAPETSSPSRLLALLRRWQTGLGPFLERRLGDEALRGRVEAFVEARDQYLAGLMAESEQQLDQAVEAYLSATKTSADFTWGYARCVQVARFYAAAGVMDRARSILTALVEARADQPMARELLQRLGE